MRPTNQETVSFVRKRDAALAILAKSGVWKSNYQSPLLRVLWWVGFRIPPFHFASFWTVVLYQTGIFCVIFGLFTYFLMPTIVPSTRYDTVIIFLLRCALTSIFYTLFVLAYHAYIRRKYKLPKWSDL